MIDVLADDTLAVWINGTAIVDYAKRPQQHLPDKHAELHRNRSGYGYKSLAKNGTNTITVIDDQTNGASSGIDFQGHLTVTLEPWSLLY